MRRAGSIGLSTVIVLGTMSPAAAAERPRPIATSEYDLGNKAFRVKGMRGGMELAGVVHHPRRPAGRRLPLVVFLHGRHATCGNWKSGEATAQWPCPRGLKPIPSHRGYDYIGRSLARRGYVVQSISANGINAKDGELDDSGMALRARLVDRHLRLWRRWAGRGGRPFGRRFARAVDLGRVGTMGHSRGGEGVVTHVRLARSTKRNYKVRAVLALAATDFHRRTVTGIPLATILPTCDGDVSDLQGVHYYDDARYKVKGDRGPKHAVAIYGANHNYFNYAWSPKSKVPGASDDMDGLNTGPVCGVESRSRLGEKRQRRIGRYFVETFFRRYLGNESSLDPVWRGDKKAPVPGRALVSYLAPNRPEWRRDINRLLRAGLLHRNTLGGKVRLKELGGRRLCGGARSQPRTCHRSVTEISEPHARGGTPKGMSVLMTRWSSKRARFRNFIPAHASDVARYRAISFRAVTDYWDARNPKRGRQRLRMTLTDRAGRHRMVDITRYADALRIERAARGRGHPYRDPRHFLLNQIRVPLSRFHGVDLHGVREVSLDYSARRKGALAITDLNFTR